MKRPRSSPAPDGAPDAAPDAAPSGDDNELRRYVRAVTRSIAQGDPHLAEDLEQQTHLSTLGRSPRDPAKVKAWLRRIALNHLHTELGRRGRSAAQAFIEERDGADDALDPAEIAMTSQLRERLQDHLDRLAPRYRSVIELRVLEGQPPRDVSRALGLPVNTVRTRTRRGLEALRAGIEAEGARQGDRDGWWQASMALPLGSKMRWVGGAAALVTGVVLVASLPGRGGNDGEELGPRAARTVAAVEPANRAPLAGIGEGSRAPAEEPAQPPTSEAPLAPTEGAPSIEVELVARHADGSPAAGAEAFALTGALFGAAEPIGTTGPDGRLEVRLPARNAMVALRGAVGQLSRTVSIDRPLGAARPQVQLVLEAHEVDWVRVRTPAPDALPEDPELIQRPEDLRDLGRIGTGAPIMGAPLWVPAWRHPDGRFGVPRVEQPSALAFLDGHRVRALGPMRPAGAPAPSEWTLPDPVEFRGRLVDEASGAALPGRTVRFIGDGLILAAPVHAVTDENGAFTFRNVPVRRGLLEAKGLDGYHRVDAGTSAARDVGDVPCRGNDATIIALGSGLGTVRGVRVYTKEDRRRWISIQTATPARQGLAVGGFTGDRATAPVRAEDVAALAVDVVGPDPFTWIIPAPPLGFPGPEIALPGPPPRPARVVVPARTIDGPKLLRFIHRASGAMVRFDVDSKWEDTDRALILSPGTWLLLCTDASGATSLHRNLELGPGSRVDLRSLVERRTQVALDWTEALGMGAPGDEMRLQLTLFVEPVLTRTLRRGDLPREVATLELEPDRYRLRLDGPQGERHDAAFTVRSDRVSPAVRPRPGQVALTLVRPGAPYSKEPTIGRIDVYGEKDELLRSFDTAALSMAGRFDLCVPASGSYRVDATLDGVAFQARIPRARDQVSIRRMLSPR